MMSEFTEENNKSRENMEKVRGLMAKAEEANLGSANRKDVAIDFTSEYGTHFKGTIVFKRPNMQDYMRMGALKAQELGRYGALDADLVDVSIKIIAQVLSTLQVVVEKAPDWMIHDGKISVHHFQEPDILYHIYSKYEDWESNFRKPVQSESEGNSTTTE